MKVVAAFENLYVTSERALLSSDESYPLVPYFHEAAYKSVANASNLLQQRGLPSYGHCTFSTPTVLGSFQTLVDWVTTGVKPVS